MNKILPQITLTLGCLFLSLTTVFALDFNGDFTRDSTAITNKKEVNELINQSKKLGFQENKGQMVGTDNQSASYVLFKAEAPGLNIWVTNTGLTYQFFTIDKKRLTNADGSPKLGQDGKQETEKKARWNRVDMVLKEAAIKKENITTSGDIIQGDARYYLGHCPDGIFDVKTFSKVVISEVYPRIDWVLYTSENGGLKHEFVVHPGADPNNIKLLYEGNGSMDIDDNQLRFGNSLGHITEGKLLCYQNETEITSSYRSIRNSTPYYLGAGSHLQQGQELTSLPTTDESLFSYELSVSINDYDKNQDLVIDPELVWGTLFGASLGDICSDIHVDANDNLFIVGASTSTNFPVLDVGGFYQSTYADLNLNYDNIILKFNSSGVLLWSTYYGGNDYDLITCVTTDINGNLWVAGQTGSTNFPMDATNFFQGTKAGSDDLFILKFDNAGNRLWTTYYGGVNDESPKDIVADSAGDIWVVGNSWISGFPVYDPGTGAYFQSIFGGGGLDAFILKFDNSGNRLWSTYYGGSSDEDFYGVEIDVSGNAWICGYTYSANFPTQNGGGYYDGTLEGSSDAVILKFANSGILNHSTHYGGNSEDRFGGIDTDLSGNVWVTGYTTSSNLTTLDAGGFYQGTYGNTRDVIFLKFDANVNLLYATYFGGSSVEDMGGAGTNVAIDGCNNVYMNFKVHTASVGVPFANMPSCQYTNQTAAGDYDNFLVKLSEDAELVWSTFIGTDKQDAWGAISVDSDDNLYFGGATSWDFPSVLSNLDLIDQGSGSYYQNIQQGSEDLIIMKFEPVILDVPAQSQTVVSNCTTCNGTATVTICGDGPYDYVWSTGDQSLKTTDTTNTVTGLCPGDYSVTITSCSSDSVVNFTIIDGYQVATSLIDTTICDGDNVQLFTSITTPPASLPCGYGSACSTAPSVYTIGTGTGNSPTYGPTYSFTNRTDSRSQFLILASELTAAGVNSGTFTTIAWDYAVVHSGSNPYENFSIKMACTNETLLSETNAWITPVTEVYASPTFLPVLGWNTITLTTTFDWDGVSNIIIETCYDNPNITYRGGHDRVRFTTQPVNMTTRRISGSGSGCTLASPTQDFTGIPNLQFTVCDAPQALPTYSWTPSTDLNNATIANPTADPTTTTQYSVITTVSGCLVYDTVDVIVDPCLPLYVSFLSFEASIEHNEVVRLDWATMVEINIDHFEIEKSINNIDWHHVTSVQSSGTSLSVLEYSTHDNNPYNGISYYRLKIIDIDGSISYSNIEAVNFSGETQFEHVLIYPNPANNEITIVGSEEALMGMKFYTLCGQEITDKLNNISRDVNGVHVDISQLSSGVYLITTKFESYKLIKY